MLCKNPYRRGLSTFGCGRCMPCLINRRRLWTGRLMLESNLHEAAYFLTLTYADAPFDNGQFCPVPRVQTLRPRDVQLWVKRLRRRTDNKVRYYLVGEYGDETFRPHYHAALFGPAISDHVPIVEQRLRKRSCMCLVCSSWGLGGVDIGNLEPASAAYIAGYITKRWTRKDDERLGGRYPEFARMSLRPGIGAPAMPFFARNLTTEVGSKAVAEKLDVINTFRSDGKSWPLGRYLSQRLRAECGFAELGEPAASAQFRHEVLKQELDGVTVQDRVAKYLEFVRVDGEKRVQSSRRAEVKTSIAASKRRLKL